MALDVSMLLADLQHDRRYRDQIVAVHRQPARQAQYAETSVPLHPVLRAALETRGIGRLYSHQAAAIDDVRAGRDVVVVTGTASGKTMCYNLPVIDRLLEDEATRALYLFPTKALAQDQLKTLRLWRDGHPLLSERLRPATYDGDTPSSDRRKIRTEANIILSNPDMLHVGILPYHGRWASFLRKLQYVVVDELHSYRGIFGSNVALVLRRLARICAHYGAHPTFVCSSATIANPDGLAEELTGRRCRLIDVDGSPRGPRGFVIWNPPEVSDDQLTRRSANIEGTELLVELVRRQTPTIAFTKARVVTELVYRYASDMLEKSRERLLAARIRPYRGGYLPQERRAIEQALFSGQLLGVVSTNALELGIDVGALDAAVLIGFPGTIAGTWQQSGRAGRGDRESLTFLVAYNDPIDQYLVRHPQYFFEQSVEHSVIDAANPYILAGHLACAAAELPLTGKDEQWFGPLLDKVRQLLLEEGKVRRIREIDYWAAAEIPSQKTSLRTISDNTVTIVDVTGGNRRAIGNVDSISAPELVYPEGIYLHEGESYQVRSLDMEGKVATVERADVDYYTQPVLADQCAIVETLEERPLEGEAGQLCFGRLDVTWDTVAFKKIKYYTGENLGQTALDLPRQTLSTMGVWLSVSMEILNTVSAMGLKTVEGLVGIRNAMLATLPMLAMCDRRDISGTCSSAQTGRPTMFVYDRFLGGIGYAEKGFELFEHWLLMCDQLINDCPCEYGCPSCVGLANLRPPLHQDPEIGGSYAIPDKIAAIEIMRLLRPALQHAAAKALEAPADEAGEAGEAGGGVVAGGGNGLMRFRGDMAPLEANLIKWQPTRRSRRSGGTGRTGQTGETGETGETGNNG